MGAQATIHNSQFGKVNIDLDKVITFPEGILGFEEIKKYVIIELAEYEPFQWLIALDDPEVMFPIISPILVRKDYDPELTKKDITKIGEFEEKDLLLYTIVTIKGKEEKGVEVKSVTANLKGPLIINQVTRLGQQVILEEPSYEIVYPLIG